MLSIDLTQQRAIVGGASRGIGAATAQRLAEAGASVTLLARSEDDLQRTLTSLATGEGQAHNYRVVDYTKPETLADALGEVAGRADVLVHNTGGPPAGAVADAHSVALGAAFTQHIVAGQALVQAVLPGMRERRYGRIVNVISTSVKEPIPGLGVSNTIRGAVASWSKTLATELAAEGITVNNLLPGFTDTQRLAYLFEMQAKAAGRTAQEMADAARSSVPAARFGKPEEQGAAIAFLASPLAAYITGINLPVDGGRTRSL
ncbi:MAG: SDR family oxidoreductase [Pseudomonadota bacterium]